MPKKTNKSHPRQSSQTISAKGLRVFVKGALRTTWVTQNVHDWLSARSDPEKVEEYEQYQRLKQTCRRICDYKGAPVPWLTPEGTHRGVSIVAVRQAQVRLYGTLCNVGATRGLLITELDPAKKSNKADKSLLDKAAQEVIKLRKN